MLYGTGMSERYAEATGWHRPMWYDGNTDNMHLNKLADKVKEGVIAAAWSACGFNTIGVTTAFRWHGRHVTRCNRAI